METWFQLFVDQQVAKSYSLVQVADDIAETDLLPKLNWGPSRLHRAGIWLRLQSLHTTTYGIYSYMYFVRIVQFSLDIDPFHRFPINLTRLN